MSKDLPSQYLWDVYFFSDEKLVKNIKMYFCSLNFW